MKYFLLFLLICSPCHADIYDISNAVIRVDNNEGIGSAICYTQDKDKYYFLGAGHSYSDGKTILSFYGTGKKQDFRGFYDYHLFIDSTIPDTKESGNTNDICVISTPKKDLQICSVDLKQVQFKKGDIVWTYGCSMGGWPTCYKGRVIKQTEDRIVFSPPPMEGRSGSILTDEKHRYIVGIVIQVMEKFYSKGKIKIEYGVAIPTNKIMKLLEENTQKNGNTNPITTSIK